MVQGNVYVTGSSRDSSYSFCYATIKYNSNGVQQWIQRFNYGRATAITVDMLGNVYVTGLSYCDSTLSDYATIKYNSNGDLQWIVRYSGPRDSESVPYSIAVDITGNIWVTGSSNEGDADKSDYITIKYNTSGQTLWVKKYNPGSDWYEAKALALDSLGNAYVTGWGWGSINACATIKYNSNGDTVWVRKYKRPTSSGSEATDIAVDGLGNVYVTGNSRNNTNIHVYTTIKYNSNGDSIWTRIYSGLSYDSINQAKSISVDDIGNVYVTGNSGTWTDYDYATIKYNSGGDTVWVRRYNGSTYSCNSAEALVIDGSGNICITGYSTGFGSGSDYVTIMYNSYGALLWASRYNECANSDDKVSAITIDDFGNVYVTGSSCGDENSDYLTVKYNSSGALLWERTYDGPERGRDYSSAIAVDNIGNVYVTGYSEDSITNYDYATIKYNSNGDTIWVRRYNGPGNGYDKANDISVDNIGNVYITGFGHSGYGPDEDYTTIKYNSNGDTVWVRRYNGPGYGFDEATAMVIDHFGNIYITGNSLGSGYNADDYATIKYNSDGVQQWIARYNGPGNGPGYNNDGANAIAVDNAGNVYVTGTSIGNDGLKDYATIKYNSLGVQQWVERYSDGISEAKAIIVVDSNNVYVAGRCTGSVEFNVDYTTIKYNAIGETLWTRKYNGPGNGADEVSSFAQDNDGNIYVTGSSYYTGSGYNNYMTVKYNPAGIEQWAIVYNGQEDAGNFAKAIAVDDLGNIYVSGESYITGNGYDYVIIKYEQIPLPFIRINESCYSRTLLPNQINDTIFSIDNCGIVNLVWSLSEMPEVGWLSENITNGVIPANSRTNLIMNFNTAGLTRGVYQSTLNITSNDTSNSIVTALVELIIPGWIIKESIPTLSSGKYVKDGGALVAVPVLAKTTNSLYAFRGNKSNEFYKYDTGWTQKETIYYVTKPPPDTLKINKKRIGKGASLCYDPDNNTIYATKGNGTKEFWAYTISDSSWRAKTFVPVPKALKGGTSIVYVNGKIYLLAGGQTKTDPNNFYAYDVNSNAWTTRGTITLGPNNKPFKDGSCITALNGDIYALKGGDKGNYFYAYDTTTHIWTASDSLPLGDSLYGKWKKRLLVKDGAAMTTDGSAIYLVKGGGTNVFWKYTSGIWMRDESIPRINKKSVVKTGAAMAYVDGYVYLLKGNNTPEFWQYPVGGNKAKLKRLMDISEYKIITSYPLALYQNEPNPFYSQTNIRYSIPVKCKTTLQIYDVLGRIVKNLVDGHKNSGVYSVNWNGSDDAGRKVEQGIYFCVLNADGQKTHKKMLILK